MRSSKTGARPQHLLCQGFRKSASYRSVTREENPISTIPGLIEDSLNTHVSMMKASLWTKILEIMGKKGDEMMIDLIMDCGIFLPIVGGQGNYYQLSGRNCLINATFGKHLTCDRHPLG
jgi:telomerase reverse transcriptase